MVKDELNDIVTCKLTHFILLFLVFALFILFFYDQYKFIFINFREFDNYLQAMSRIDDESQVPYAIALALNNCLKINAKKATKGTSINYHLSKFVVRP